MFDDGSRLRPLAATRHAHLFRYRFEFVAVSDGRALLWLLQPLGQISQSRARMLPRMLLQARFLESHASKPEARKNNLTTQASQEAIRKMASRCLWLTRLEFRVLQPLQRKRRGFDLCTDSNEAPRPWHRSWRCRGNADRRTRSILVPRRHASKIEVFFSERVVRRNLHFRGESACFLDPFFMANFQILKRQRLIDKS